MECIAFAGLFAKAKIQYQQFDSSITLSLILLVVNPMNCLTTTDRDWPKAASRLHRARMAAADSSFGGSD